MGILHHPNQSRNLDPPKYSKWFMKTLESVHPNGVRRIGTVSSTKQDNGGDIDDLDSRDVSDMEVSYDYELNLSTNFEPTSFEEVVSHNEWKEVM